MKRQPYRYKYDRTAFFPHIVSMEGSLTATIFGTTFIIIVTLLRAPLTTHSSDTIFDHHVPVQTAWRADL